MPPDHQETRTFDVREKIRQIHQQLRSPRILKLELILTEACNLGCSYCFEYGADSRKMMPESLALASIDFLIEASRDSSWVSVSFIGGEPMLRFDLISSVMEYGRKVASRVGKTITFSMQTNGVLIKESHARFFRDSVLRYCLSIDGGKRSHDAYRTTHNGTGTYAVLQSKMKMLKRYQHWQGARMTIMPSEARLLGENIRALHEELAINQFVIGVATHVAWEDQQIAEYKRGLEEAFDYYLEQRIERKSHRLRIGFFELGQLDTAHSNQGTSRWGCGAGSSRLAVGVDGVLHGCSKLAWEINGGSSRAPLPLGSIENGMNRANNRLKLLDRSIAQRTKCTSCEIQDSCQGGCHATNFVDTGNIYIPADYFCKLMFAQKQAADYARRRVTDVGLADLFWETKMPDLENPNDSHGEQVEHESDYAHEVD